MKKHIKAIVLSFICMAASCADPDELERSIPDAPTTPAVVSFTKDKAYFLYFKESSFRIQIGTTPKLDKNTEEPIVYAEGNSFNRRCCISNLKPATTYYYRAFKSNSLGDRIYGEIKSFTTSLEINNLQRTGIYAASQNDITIKATTHGPEKSLNVIEAGFCFSQQGKLPTHSSPDVIIKKCSFPASIGDSKTYELSTNGYIDEFPKGTTTYARAFVKTDEGISYSTESIIYYNVSEIRDGRPCIDLGLPSGILWTAVNMRGEGYTDTNYMPSEYSVFFSEGFQSKKLGTFRLPTYTDAKELHDNCTCTTETIDGKYCARITGPNGNVVYIPYSGYRVYYGYGYNSYETGLEGCGYTWLSTKTDDGCYRLLKVSDSEKIQYTYYMEHGDILCAIRLVTDK